MKNPIKRTLLAAALALAGVVQANQIVIDRPPDTRGFDVSRHYATLADGTVNTFFGTTDFDVTPAQTFPAIPAGFELTQFQLYLGSYSQLSTFDGLFGPQDGSIVGPWHGKLNGSFAIAPPLVGNTDPLALVTVPVAFATDGVLRIESDIPIPEGITGVIEYGLAHGFTGTSFNLSNCTESWFIGGRDCQAKDGDFSLAFRAVFNSVPEPNSVALVFAGIAAAAWTFRKKHSYCKACGGEGWLPSLPEGKSECPYCKGTGKERDYTK